MVFPLCYHGVSFRVLVIVVNRLEGLEILGGSHISHKSDISPTALWAFGDDSWWFPDSDITIMAPSRWLAHFHPSLDILDGPNLTATRPSKSPPCWQKGRPDEFLAFEMPEMWHVSRCLQIPQLLSQMDKKNFHMEKHFWIPFIYFLHVFPIPLVIWSVPLDVRRLWRWDAVHVESGIGDCHVYVWYMFTAVHLHENPKPHIFHTLHFLGWYGCWSGSCCSFNGLV